MKRKFISVALFGALLAASTSVTTSCKDYDDDISGLQTQIDDGQTSWSEQAGELQKALEEANKNIATAQQDIKTANENILKAQNAGDDAAKSAAEAARLAGEAKEAAAQAKKEAIEEAQKLVAELQKEIPDVSEFLKEADLADYAKIETVNAQIKAIEDGLNGNIQKVLDGMGLTPETVEALKNLGDIQEMLAQLKTQQAAIDKFTEILGADGSVLDEKLKANLEAANKAIDEKIAEHAKVLDNYVTSEDLKNELGKYYTSEKVDELLTTAKNEYTKLVGDLDKELQAKIDGVQTDLGGKISNLNTELSKKIDSDISELTETVGKVNSNLITLLGKTLRGLVFSPNLYVGGIESAEYGYLAYDYNKEGKSMDATNNDGKKCVFPNGSAFSVLDSDHFNPVDTIEYHLNPSSATLPENSLSFLSRDVDVIKRASSVAAPEVKGFKVEDGMVRVALQVDGPSVTTNYEDSQSKEGNGTTGNIFALQAKIQDEAGKDTVITSDYAMLYASKIIPQAIAFSNENYGGVECKGQTKLYDELYATAKDAIESKDNEILLKYDDPKGFDFKTILCSHFKWETATKNAADHGSWAYGEEAHYGLHYAYDLVDYEVVGNNTKDSKYATISKDGVIVAHGVNADGSIGNNGDRSAVGREPLVRVRLLDGKDRVVLYGFVRVKITDQIENKVTDAIVKNSVVDDCNADDYEVKWYEISKHVLTKLNMSNEEFNAIYKIDAQNGSALQYVPKTTPVADGTEFELAVGTEIIGEVKETTEGEGTQTSKLVWTLTSCEQQAIYEGTNHTATIYVRYVKKTDKTKRTALYLPLTVTYKRDGQVANLDYKKKEEVWAWGAKKDAGMNVSQPEDDGTTIPYVQDFNTILYGDKFILPAGYDEDNVIYYFRQSTTADNLYTLTVDDDFAHHNCTDEPKDPTAENAVQYPLTPDKGVYKNDKVYYNGQVVATIDQKTGVITYAQTAAAKTILNAYGTNKYDEPQAFLRIGVAVKGECMIMPLANNEFNDYILRPINLNSVDGAAFKDATANGAKVKLADVVDFSDWRQEHFVTSNYANVWYFGFYGIQNVLVSTDLSKVKTNMSQTSADKFVPVQEVSPSMKLSYTPGTNHSWQWVKDNCNSMAESTQANYDEIKELLGEITYDNNRTPVRKAFTLRFPVTVIYDWGEFTEYIDVLVKPVGE